MAAKRLKRVPPMNPNAPVLSKEDYFTIPAVKRLRRFSDEELQVNISHAVCLEANHSTSKSWQHAVLSAVETIRQQSACVHCNTTLLWHCLRSEGRTSICRLWTGL